MNIFESRFLISLIFLQPFLLVAIASALFFRDYFYNSLLNYDVIGGKSGKILFTTTLFVIVAILFAMIIRFIMVVIYSLLFLIWISGFVDIPTGSLVHLMIYTTSFLLVMISIYR